MAVFLSSLLNPLPPQEESAPGSFLLGLAKAHAQPMDTFRPDYPPQRMPGLSPDATTAEIQAFARRKARQMFGPGQWPELNALVNQESGWNPQAQNPSSTAFGLMQFLDSTWGGTGFDKTTDPRQQLLAGFRYIANRYGDPENAWATHQSQGWY